MATTDYEAVPAVERDDAAPHAGTVVMKFGGSSVADPEKLKNVARRLVAAREGGSRVVAVLSAMGSTTDELLALARQVSPRPEPRELDMLISVGERISVALAAMAINDLGQEAISLTGSQAGIVTEFQGVSTGQEITTLGRGGSDTTAVALAAALGAESCEIFTDVEGVYTADPRVVPAARKLHAVSYEEMLEMAASGARVLALRSVEFARNHDVKLHVRSTFTEEEGTWIIEEDERMLEKAMISGVTHTLEEAVYAVHGVERADLFAALADAAVSVDTIIQTGDEILFSAPVEDRAETAAVL